MRRVVIVGGGFGGVSVARQLARRSSRKDIEIVLVDDKHAHVYTPWLYEVATAVSPVQGSGFVRRARKCASILFAHFPGFRAIRIVRARVNDVARDGSHVVLQDGTTLSADALVITVGARTNDFGIPGVQTFANSLKTDEEAERIALHMQRILHDIVERRTERASIVVAGAGANGVELVAEIAAVRKAFLEAYEVEPQKVRLMLCDAGAEPVSMFPQSVRKNVQKRLKKLGVEFFGKTAIQEVTAGEVRAASVSISFDLLIWSAGVKSQKEPGEAWGLPVNERGRICVSDTFAIEGRKNMFALGDAAARGNHPDPQSAQVASAQAPYVAKNVLAFLEGKEQIVFPKKHWQTLLAVGGSYGVGQVLGIPIKGRTAFWLRRLVDLRYFLSVFPFMHACIVWYRGVETYGENDVPRA